MRTPILLVTAVLSTACGDMTRADTREAFGVVIATVVGAGNSAQGSVADLTSGPSAAVDHLWDCPDGGTVHVVGSAGTCIAGDETDQIFMFTVEVSDCAAGSTTLAGSLTYSMATDPADGYLLRLAGDLSFAGELNGECDVDLQYSVKVIDDKLRLVYHGSMCGHDADALQLERAGGSFPPYHCY